MRTHRVDRQPIRPPAIREVCLTGGPDQKYVHTTIADLAPVRTARPDRVRTHSAAAVFCSQR